MPGKLRWAPFGPTCIKLYDLKLGIIRGIISEHAVAMGTVKNAFQLVTQLVDQRRSLSWLSRCKREKVSCAPEHLHTNEERGGGRVAGSVIITAPGRGLLVK